MSADELNARGLRAISARLTDTARALAAEADPATRAALAARAAPLTAAERAAAAAVAAFCELDHAAFAAFASRARVTGLLHYARSLAAAPLPAPARPAPPVPPRRGAPARGRGARRARPAREAPDRAAPLVFEPGEMAAVIGALDSIAAEDDEDDLF